MPSSIYILFLILLISVIVALGVVARYKKTSHTELYREGVRNENDGHYKLALQNYEDALIEIKKLKLDNKFGVKIALRVKILRTFLDYESSFQTTPKPRQVESGL